MEAAKKDLKEILKGIEGGGALIESQQPGPEDSFIFWLKSLFQKKINNQ